MLFKGFEGTFFPYLRVNDMVSRLAELKQASCCGQVVGLVGEDK